MADCGILDAAFEELVRAACVRAREDTLKAGVPVFYRDVKADIYVMEQPDGRRFEIRFIPGRPREDNYQVLRELGKTAA